MKLSEAMLPEFDHEMATTRRVLERVPDEKFGWKPHAKSFSMGDLATHVMNLPGWLTDIVGKDEYDIAPGGQPLKQPQAASRKQLLEQFDANVKAGRAALASVENDQLGKNWSLLTAGKTAFSMPRAGVIRSFVMNHLIHHRAQLSVYLRLNDLPVPSMYGPSADESPM